MLTINHNVKNANNQQYKSFLNKKRYENFNNLSDKKNLLCGMPNSNLIKVYYTGTNNLSFKGQIEDDFFKAAKSGDISGQLKGLSNLQFDISEVDLETGNNFLHVALKSPNKQLINKALLLLGQKAGNDRELAKAIVNKLNNENKKPYDYTTDPNTMNILRRIVGEDLTPNVSASNSTTSTNPTESEESIDPLNKLPEGTILEIPSLDDEDDDGINIAESPQIAELPNSLVMPPLSEVAGLNNAKKILIGRIVAPLSQGRQVIDSGFLIHGTTGNGKSFLLDSLEKSLNKKKIDFKTFGILIDAAKSETKNDKEQQKNIANIFAKNIVQVNSVQDLEFVTDFAKVNFTKTKQQAIIYIDEIKGLLPDVSAPNSTQVTLGEQLIEKSAENGYVIVATTREMDAIKPDSIRKDRFDEHIEVKLPSADERKDLIRKYFAGSSNLSDRDFNSFVKLSSGFSYLNLSKFLKRLNENETANFDYIKNELQKYAYQNKLGKLSDRGTTANYDPVDLPRTIITKPANFNDVAGMKEAKHKFQELLIDALKPDALEAFRESNMPPIKAGFLLYGPPGTGKTYIAEALAGEMNLPLYKLDAANFEDKYVGESEKKLRRIFEALETKFRETGEYSILFIDEADSILGNREKLSENKAGLVNQFLQYLNNAAEKGIIVVTATNFKDKIDKAIVSRLGEPIKIDPPDAEARKELIKLTIKDVKTAKNLSDEDVNEIASRLSGLGAREISYILHTTISKSLKYGKVPLKLEDFKREIANFAASHEMPEINDRNKTSAYDTVLPRLQISPDDPQTLDDLGGMKEVKEQLIDAIGFESNNPAIVKRLKDHGVGNPANILLYGEPGCGKTYILKAAAAHFNLPIYEYKLSEQGTSLVHGTTKNIGDIFNQLKEKYKQEGEKSILLLDEFEDVAGKRDNAFASSHKVEETNALLKEIQDAPENGIIIVAATNFYNKIDDAMKRPGRFKQIYVPFPDYNSRLDIIKKTLSRGDIAEQIVSNEESIKKLAEITEGLSVADITETIKPFIKNSIMQRVDKLTVEDFVELFSNFKKEKELAKEKGK